VKDFETQKRLPTQSFLTGINRQLFSTNVTEMWAKVQAKTKSESIGHLGNTFQVMNSLKYIFIQLLHTKERCV
jgi:hypothetical protein